MPRPHSSSSGPLPLPRGAEHPPLAGAASKALVVLLRAYQRVLRPVLPPSCRFFPSCSEFAIEAVRTHGCRRGVVLALRRIGRCHPWHPGGFDPVPGKGS